VKKQTLAPSKPSRFRRPLAASPRLGVSQPRLLRRLPNPHSQSCKTSCGVRWKPSRCNSCGAATRNARTGSRRGGKVCRSASPGFVFVTNATATRAGSRRSLVAAPQELHRLRLPSDAAACLANLRMGIGQAPKEPWLRNTEPGLAASDGESGRALEGASVCFFHRQRLQKNSRMEHGGKFQISSFSFRENSKQKNTQKWLGRNYWITPRLRSKASIARFIRNFGQEVW